MVVVVVVVKLLLLEEERLVVAYQDLIGVGGIVTMLKESLGGVALDQCPAASLNKERNFARDSSGG